MTRATSHGSTGPSLVERKQQRARQRIIDAAEELFSERGFDAVSVSDIATHAEVGRTTFFRYFGDKSEVVFAKQQALLEAVALAGQDSAAPAARTLREAVEQLRPLVVSLCAQAAQDPQAYLRHLQLLEQHPELRARSAMKDQQVATGLAGVLTGRGTGAGVALLAAHLSLGCAQAARAQAASSTSLAEETDAAFGELLNLPSA